MNKEGLRGIYCTVYQKESGEILLMIITSENSDEKEVNRNAFICRSDNDKIIEIINIYLLMTDPEYKKSINNWEGLKVMYDAILKNLE